MPHNFRHRLYAAEGGDVGVEVEGVSVGVLGLPQVNHLHEMSQGDTAINHFHASS